MKNWKRRFFKVENGLLTYFETSGDTKNLGQVRAARTVLSRSILYFQQQFVCDTHRDVTMVMKLPL